MDQLPNLTCYVGNSVVEELPDARSALECVMASGAREIVSVQDSILAFSGTFLSSDVRSLLLLGEAGCGKSLFMLWAAQQWLGLWSGLLDTPLSRLSSPELPWLPLLVELKSYQPLELVGLVAKLVPNLRQIVWCPASRQPRVRLLVLCDGLDELRGTPRELPSDFGSTLLGELANSISVAALKIVITGRESALSSRVEEHKLFGHHVRRILLPFSDPQVRAALHS